MNILVQVHINNDFDDSGITCALIKLDTEGIKKIFRLAKKAGKDHTIQEFDYTPEFGTSDLDLDNMEGHYWDIDKLSEEELQQVVFAQLEDVRIDVSQLNVDAHDFWWEGVFKHTDIRWSTNLIPLKFLPQETRATRAARDTNTTTPGLPKPDLDMTTEQMNALHEKIAEGINHGLNAREIADGLRATKPQLVRIIMEIIERNH